MKLSIINIIFICIFILIGNSNSIAKASNSKDISYSEMRSPNIDVIFTENICNGGNGKAYLNITGGTGPFLYQWSTGDIAPEITYTEGGTYWVKVTDTHNNTSETKQFTVIEHPKLEVSIVSENITCFNDKDGKAKAEVTNGTPPYNFEWSTTLKTQEISKLVPGNYTVTVSDKFGCTGTASTKITSPEKIIVTLSPQVGICKGQNTELVADAKGGVAPYTFIWNDDPSINDIFRIVSPQETFTYSVAVKDDNGCESTPASTTVTVSQPIEITTEIKPIKCNGDNNAEASLKIKGGVSPFSYSWESPTNTISELSPGIYNVTIIDRFECKGEVTFKITEPDLMVINYTTQKPICHDMDNGIASLSVSGGLPLINDLGHSYYTYLWNSGETESTIMTIPGDYKVSVTDALECTQTVDIKIENQEPIYITDPKDGAICKGETYTTSSQATGGISPYVFVWTNPEDSGWSNYGEVLTVSPSTTTTYHLQVTDKNGCFAPKKTIKVSVSPSIKIQNFKVESNEICLGDEVTISADIEGGNGGPYHVKFDNSTDISLPYTFFPEISGSHYIQVEDNCNSPSDKKVFSIKVNPLPNVMFYSETSTSCIPGIFEFIESSSETVNSLLWEFGDGNSSIDKSPKHKYEYEGLYTVSLTATSSDGCKKTVSYDNYIEIYPNPIADFTSDPISASILDPHIKFKNESRGGVDFFIDYGDGNSSIWETDYITHSYSNIGNYTVKLIANSEYECADTIEKPVSIHEGLSFYAPTAFTPNGDGVNDLFYITGNGIEKDSFTLRIYDRNGILIYETTDFDTENVSKMAWDGTIGSLDKGDKIIPNGVYTWYCSFTDYRGKPHFRSGNVTLFR